MLSYLTLISACGVFACLEAAGFKDSFVKNNLIFFRLGLLFILLLFIGLRYKVGADWYQYYIFFTSIEDLNTILFDKKNALYFWEYPWEIGFKLFVGVLKSVQISYQGLIFTITLINLWCLNKFLKETLDKEKCLFLLVFLSLNMLREFDILRQSLAFYLFLLAYRYINKSFLKYLLICILASLFHLSAIILIIIYPLFRLKVSRRFLIITLILFLLSLIYKFKFLTTFVEIMEKLLPGGPIAVILHQVKLYLEFYPIQSNINLITILCILLLIMIITFFGRLDSFDQRFIILFLIFIYISIIFSEVGEVQSRFGYYFSTGIAYCASRLIVIFRGYNKLAYVFILILYANVKVILPFRIEATMLTYTPYRNYLFYLDENITTETEIMNRYNKAHEMSADFFSDNVDN